MSDGSIHVETAGLAEFAGGVRFYAEVIDPLDVQQAERSFSAGVTFGTTNVSLAVLGAKRDYAEALAGSLTNLTRFVEAARILATAAEQAAEGFRAVDDESARSIDNLRQLSTIASAEVRQ